MTIYTPPSLNAVDFPVTSFIPEVLPPNESALSGYTPPSLNAVDFELSVYTQPTFPTVDFELLNAPAQEIVGASFTNLTQFGSGTVANSDGTVVVPGTNDENTFSPVPRKLKDKPFVDISALPVQEVRSVDIPIEIAFEHREKIAVSLSAINKEIAEVKIAEKAHELRVFLQSEVIRNAFSAISSAENTRIKREVDHLITMRLLQLKAEKVQDELEKESLRLAQKEIQLQKLNRRIEKAKQDRAIREEEVQKSLEEEEYALLYMLLDS